MTREPEDRILETSLEETLGGVYPPDLTAKIMQTWEQRLLRAEPAATAPPVTVPIAPPPAGWLHEPTAAVPPAAPAAELPARPIADRKTRGRRHLWTTAASVAAGLLIVVAIGTLAIVQPNGQTLVDTSGSTPGIDEIDEPGGLPHPDVRIREQSFASSDPDTQPSNDTRNAVTPPSVIPGPLNPVVAEQPRPSRPVRQSRTPSSEPEILAFVNDILREQWQRHSVTPSPPASDSDWCRRVYQRLVGRSPSLEELDDFRGSQASNKRSELVDALLESDEYARHWSNLWSEALLGVSDLPKSRAEVDRDELTEYLYESVRDDKPFDQLTRELLTATGSSDPAEEGYNGAVNYLMAGANENAVAATDRTCRVFLGRQLVCARCHDYAAARTSQEEFWQLNSFFRQMRLDVDPQTRQAVLTDADFRGESGAPKDAEVFYRELDGSLRIAYPEFKGYELPHSGLVADVHRRQELAELIVNSDEFSRAAVNRLWAELMGFGFTQPVDDMGPHNPPSHPELLDRLSGELAAHDFDLDRLVRWIVLSDAFGLSSKPTPESWMDTPETGGQPLFARYYEPQRAPEDLTRAFLAAADAGPARDPSTQGSLARRTWLGPPAVGRLDIIDSQATDRVTGNGWLDLLAKSRMSREEKVEHVFLSVLDRRPTPRESQAAKLVLADRMNDAVALREIWQMLLTSR